LLALSVKDKLRENMIRAKIEPMPGNPAARYMGDQSGLWKVVIYDYGTRGRRDPNTSGEIHTENLSHPEAVKLSSRLEDQLNS
jgi:hypothetical protein